MTAKEKNKIVAKAKMLGTKAFNDGKRCVPAYDSELMSLIKDFPMGDKLRLKAMKAWSKFWTIANLDAPLPQ